LFWRRGAFALRAGAGSFLLEGRVCRRRASGGRGWLVDWWWEGWDGVTEPVIVITRPHVHVHDADLSRRERDRLVLTAEERRWGRRRVTTEKGRTLALALPTGSQLVPGEILHVAAEWYVVIEAAPEAVLAVTPRSREEGLRVAFEVGNRHFSLALDGGRLLVADDPAMEQLLMRLGVTFERTQAVFVPIGLSHRHEH
jgi:urease accessory protein